MAAPCLFADSFGICLSGFLDTRVAGEDCTSTSPPPPSSAAQFEAQSTGVSLAPLAVLAVFPLFALLTWYICRQRRETRKRTAEFANQLDNHEVDKRLHALAADEELEGKNRRGLKALWLQNKVRVANSRSQEKVQTGRDRPSYPQAAAKPESVHMQDFSKRSSFDDIGQDPAPPEPPRGSSFSPPVRACRAGNDPTSVRVPSTAPSTNLPVAPKASLDLTHLWPNLPSRPNAL